MTFMVGYVGSVSIEHLKSEYCLDSGVRGGGKCPEEEHTTCSGGPTIVIVTSAVYGERENIYIKYKYILYKYKK
jgi:hypothetical protein